MVTTLHSETLQSSDLYPKDIVKNSAKTATSTIRTAARYAMFKASR